MNCSHEETLVMAGGIMRKLELLPGDEISRACQRLASAAPAFMVFNGARVEARPGDTPGDLQARWQATMDVLCEASEKKRRAYAKTPEGKREIAASRQRAEDENRAREETLAYVAASGLREKYLWTAAMGEISGFGGAYEQACRDMLYTGLLWLEQHPGVLWNQETCEALGQAVLVACPGCSGAMHGAVMQTCGYVLKNGWSKYVEVKSDKR